MLKLEKKPRICRVCGKEFIPETNEKSCSPKCRLEHKLRYKTEYNKKHRKSERRRLEREIRMKLGNCCLVCGSHKKLHRHQIRGEPHPNLTTIRALKSVLANLNDFALLCSKHHNLVHKIARCTNYKSELERLNELVILLKKSERLFISKIPFEK